jgi:hypothetical protein
VGHLKIIKTILILSVIAHVTAQGAGMKKDFYIDWVAGESPEQDPKNVYSKSYTVVEFKAAGGEIKHAKQDAGVGMVSFFGNALRNGNCGIKPHFVNDIGKAHFVKIEASPVECLLCGDQSIIVTSQGNWNILDPHRSPPSIAGGSAGKALSVNLHDGYFYDKSLFIGINRFNGKVEKNILWIMDDILHIDAIDCFHKSLVLTSFSKQTNAQDYLENNRCIEIVPEDKILKEKPKRSYFEIKDSRKISFRDSQQIYPVLLHDCIVQPLTDNVLILSYSGEIIRVIHGEFQPLFVSADREGLLYMIVKKGAESALWAFTFEGKSIFQSTLPDSLGRIDNPPLVSSASEILVIGNDGLAKFDKKGTLVHSVDVPYHSQTPLFPLFYDDLLTVGYGQHVVMFDAALNIIFSSHDIEGAVTTPLVSVDGKTVCVGSSEGLFLLALKSDKK